MVSSMTNSNHNASTISRGHLIFLVLGTFGVTFLHGGSLYGAEKVVVNHLAVAFKSSNGMTTAFPDVCETPTPAGPIPIPYPNIAMSGDTTKGSKKVKIAGKDVTTKSSNVEKSIGDEAGVRKWAISPPNRKNIIAVKNSEFAAGAYPIRVGGKLVIRSPDPTAYDSGSGVSTGFGRVASSQTKVLIHPASGKEYEPRESTLLELEDGIFCAICMRRGKVTSIRLLTTTHSW